MPYRLMSGQRIPSCRVVIRRICRMQWMRFSCIPSSIVKSGASCFFGVCCVKGVSGGDITHAVPDNTGYITEGQLFLRRDSDIGKVIVDPFRSLSRLKQLVTGKKTRKDHPQVMNAAVRLYADAANAKTKLENGFDLTNYDERTLAFAKDYSNQLLAIDVNLDTTEMLDVAWSLFGKYFRPEEVNIKKELVDQFWPKAN